MGKAAAPQESHKKYPKPFIFVTVIKEGWKVPFSVGALSELWDVSDPYQPLQSQLRVFPAVTHRQMEPVLQYSTVWKP